MKLLFVLLAGTLAACQSLPARAPGTGQMGHGMHGMGKDSWYGMCEMHKRIMNAPTLEERQALAEKCMPGMSPAMRERHLDMMRERCR